MIEVQSTLNGETNKIEEGKAYLVDFSRLNSVNDLMVVLSGLGITYPYNHPLIEHLKPFLNLENPIDMPTQQPQPKKAPFIPLDKLDTPLEKRIFEK
jgi:hypothetical protein